MSHLKVSERKSIETMLKAGESFAAIALALDKSPSTISREVRKHRQPSDRIGMGRIKNRCINRKTCTKLQLCLDRPDCVRKCSTCKYCNSICQEFKEEVCQKLSKPPYVCNGCEKLKACPLKKFLYVAKDAETEYETVLSESRSGFNLCEDEVGLIDAVVSPCLKKGQSLYHITNHSGDRLPCSARTLYRVVDSRLISARNADMPRVCRMKPRKKKVSFKIDRACRIGRSIEDFSSFMTQNPGLGYSQMDTVEGVRGGKVLLTIHIVQFDFMLAFIRDANTAASVADVFAWLRTTLPKKAYNSMFYVLLTDNGSEFSNPRSIEMSENGEQVSRVFYCDPNAPFQKPNVELNHEFIRKIRPKGRSINDLTQADVNRMMSHINSYAREKFMGKSPTDMFIKTYGKRVLRLLGQERIKPEDIILKPELLKK